MVQGAALGSVLGPPVLAAVTIMFGGWVAAWWTMMVCPGIGLAATIALRRAERRLTQRARSVS